MGPRARAVSQSILKPFRRARGPILEGVCSKGPVQNFLDPWIQSLPNIMMGQKNTKSKSWYEDDLKTILETSFFYGPPWNWHVRPWTSMGLEDESVPFSFSGLGSILRGVCWWYLWMYPPETNMTMENPPFQDVFPVVLMGIFQCHSFVFRECLSCS